MKTVAPAFQTHLEQEVTYLATCWKVTRTDGVIFGFTDHDEDIVYGGVTYESSAGYTPTSIQTSNNLAVDNLEVQGLLDSSNITEADLMAGLWDYATVEIFQIIYNDTAHGTLKLRKGHLGEVKSGRSGFTAELRGLMQAFTTQIGELYSVSCRADLGDARCKKALGPFTEACEVTTVISNNQIFDMDSTEADGYFSYGKLTWTSGDNDGLSMEVKRYTVGHVILELPMPYDIVVGDTFDIIAGCDKLIATCKATFDNVDNFRGEPYVPGFDKVIRGPDY
jgi:uncharacterized phage protein (TIGR02218 family)